jgi:PEP-CTERM motif
MKYGILLASLIFAAASAPAANASIDLNFAGLNGHAEEQPLDYYNGGVGGLGSGPGPNFGITFGSDAISCDGGANGTCNVDQIPGGPGAQVVFFLTGDGDIMDKSSGFDTGFSFFYSAINVPGDVTVWSGLDGTGTMLADLSLPVTPSGGGDCVRTFCPFVAAGITFSGTAMSVNFSGTQNQIAFADITLGSATPGTPEPSTWAMMIMGFAGLGYIARRKGLTIRSAQV